MNLEGLHTHTRAVKKFLRFFLDKLKPILDDNQCKTPSANIF